MSLEREECKKFPSKPGIYMMKDAKGTVLYVGKAKSLRQRIQQYFRPGGDGRAMIPFLLKQLASIETLVVNSEKEALLLENNLIKRHQPRYNILLKDDKNYIAIEVDLSHPFPRLLLTRHRKKGPIYLGPYASGIQARTTVELLNQLFLLRSCSDEELARRKRPCILHGMGRCSAPCVGLNSEEAYKKSLTEAIDVLKGGEEKLVSYLTAQMTQAAEQLEFERAAALKKKIGQLRALLRAEQQVELAIGGDVDAIGLHREADRGIIALLERRSGKLIGGTSHPFTESIQEDEELLSSFILQYYEASSSFPQELVVELPTPLRNKLAELLTDKAGKKVRVLCGKTAPYKSLLDMAQLNAREAWGHKQNQIEGEELLFALQEQLGLSRYPERIDCIDISHMGGQDPVAAIVVYRGATPAKALWRTYHLRQATEGDDYGAMGEVVRRRLAKAMASSEAELPDLLLLDGGAGQLSVVSQVLAELKVSTVDVVALAKEEGRHDKGGRAEKVYLPHAKEPLLLQRHSPLLFFLQRIRDETHRFVLQFQKKQRSRTLLKSALDDIPAIGPVKKRALLQVLGSVAAIDSASDEALLAIPGIGKKELLALRRALSSD